MVIQWQYTSYLRYVTTKKSNVNMANLRLKYCKTLSLRGNAGPLLIWPLGAQEQQATEAPSTLHCADIQLRCADIRLRC